MMCGPARIAVDTADTIVIVCQAEHTQPVEDYRSCTHHTTRYLSHATGNQPACLASERHSCLLGLQAAPGDGES